MIKKISIVIIAFVCGLLTMFFFQKNKQENYTIEKTTTKDSTNVFIKNDSTYSQTEEIQIISYKAKNIEIEKKNDGLIIGVYRDSNLFATIFYNAEIEKFDLDYVIFSKVVTQKIIIQSEIQAERFLQITKEKETNIKERKIIGWDVGIFYENYYPINQKGIVGFNTSLVIYPVNNFNVKIKVACVTNFEIVRPMLNVEANYNLFSF